MQCKCQLKVGRFIACKPFNLLSGLGNEESYGVGRYLEIPGVYPDLALLPLLPLPRLLFDGQEEELQLDKTDSIGSDIEGLGSY